MLDFSEFADKDSLPDIEIDKPLELAISVNAECLALDDNLIKYLDAILEASTYKHKLGGENLQEARMRYYGHFLEKFADKAARRAEDFDNADHLIGIASTIVNLRDVLADRELDKDYICKYVSKLRADIIKGKGDISAFAEEVEDVTKTSVREYADALQTAPFFNSNEKKLFQKQSDSINKSLGNVELPLETFKPLGKSF